MKKTTLYRDAIVAIIIECEAYGGKAEAELVYASGSVSDCDMCGSHGSVEVEVRCACGGMHTIEVEGW